MRIKTPSTIKRHRAYALFFCSLLLLCQLIAPVTAEAATGSRYAIVLASAPGENLKWEPRKNQLFDDYTLFVEKTSINGSPWERLCLGFFSPREEAKSLLKELQQAYPGAWVHAVSTKNILATIHSPTGPRTENSSAKTPKQSATSNASSLTDKQLDSLMRRAKTDFKNKKYSSSIRYLNALIAAGQSKYSPEALEYLGMARQRNNQKAHAVDAYKKYLKLYPESDGSIRVGQRLAGLQTETAAARKNLKMTTDGEQDSLQAHGSLSQFYQNYRTSIDDVGFIESQSQLITFFDLNALYKSPSFNHQFQFTSDHVYDFINDDFIDNSDASEFRFIETYYELAYRKTGTSGRIGRQRLQVGGILQRFDGLTAGYQLNPDWRLNFLAGFPVDFDNKTSINKHKTFYGFTFETGTFLNNWNMNLFYFDQKNDGLTDRNSIGTEVRYRDRQKALFGLVDYDLFYDEINILQLNGSIVFDQGKTAYINVLVRQSPLLTTSNALIGRQEQSIDELKKVLNIEQIYQLARDRTANSQTTAVGGSLPLNKLFQLSADITFFHIGETEASGGVPATPDTGTDYYLTTQLIGSSLLMKNDTNVFGVRYYKTDPSDTISFIANSRFPITRNWRVNPRLQYDIRQLKDGQSRKLLRALFRTNYRFRSNVRFDFEIGYDTNSGENVSQLLGDSSLFFTLGYRWDY